MVAKTEDAKEKDVRFNALVPETKHGRLKVWLVQQGRTMREWLIEKIDQDVPAEVKPPRKGRRV